MTLNRRDFVVTAAATGAGLLSWPRRRVCAAQATEKKLHLATNSYPWITFYRRDNKDFDGELDASLGAVAESGVDGFEPILNRPEDVARLGPLLKKHGLEMRSFYVNSLLHEAAQADQSIRDILAIARRARDVGSKIVVTNPSPIRWGGTANKNDAQLRTQADALNRLGESLRDLSLVLAYHNHDMEMRCSAREFHHMMLGTDPDHVTLCLDAHWIYRGSANSNVALFDIVKLYVKRVSELHIRQSVDQVWTETLCDGDIDYAALVTALVDAGVCPHLVLEQAVESQTPQTMDAVTAHRTDCKYARRVFAPLVT